MDDGICSNEKIFCCEGCKMVYELLNENNLCTYYQLSRHPGNRPPVGSLKRLAWLDDQAVAGQLLTFSENDMASVKFSVPNMHCAACIWLLESLPGMQKVFCMCIPIF